MDVAVRTLANYQTAGSRLATGRLGRLMRERRNQLGITQAQAAQEVGWSQTEISELELVGEENPDRKEQARANIRMDKLVQLGAIYGLTPNDIAATAGWYTGGNPDADDDPLWLVLEEMIMHLPEERRIALIRQFVALTRAERLAGSPSGSRQQRRAPR